MFENFQVTYRLNRKEVSEPIDLQDAVSLPFESYLPVRQPKVYHGQKHFPNLYFFSRTYKHLYCESRHERAVVMLLDFVSDTKAISTQPFGLHYTYDGKKQTHYPDIFVRTESGKVRIVDAKPKKFVNQPKNQLQFEATQIACKQVGWQYEVHTEPNRTLFTNVSWLAGFRGAAADASIYSGPLIEACAEQPRQLDQLVTNVGPSFLVRPVLFWLLWCQYLHIDLYRPMTNATWVALEKDSLNNA